MKTTPVMRFATFARHRRLHGPVVEERRFLHPEPTLHSERAGVNRGRDCLSALMKSLLTQQLGLVRWERRREGTLRMTTTMQAVTKTKRHSAAAFPSASCVFPLAVADMRSAACWHMLAQVPMAPLPKVAEPGRPEAPTEASAAWRAMQRIR